MEMLMRKVLCLTVLLAAAVSAAGADKLANAVRASGVTGGVVVHLGCRDGRETVGLRINDKFLVQGLSTSEKEVQSARANILAAGAYGRVSAAKYDGGCLAAGAATATTMCGAFWP
jgi:hypothetical protein